MSEIWQTILASTVSTLVCALLIAIVGWLRKIYQQFKKTNEMFGKALETLDKHDAAIVSHGSILQEHAQQLGDHETRLKQLGNHRKDSR